MSLEYVSHVIDPIQQSMIILLKPGVYYLVELDVILVDVILSPDKVDLCLTSEIYR